MHNQGEAEPQGVAWHGPCPAPPASISSLRPPRDETPFARYIDLAAVEGPDGTAVAVAWLGEVLIALSRSVTAYYVVRSLPQPPPPPPPAALPASSSRRGPTCDAACVHTYHKAS